MYVALHKSQIIYGPLCKINCLQIFINYLQGTQPLK